MTITPLNLGTTPNDGTGQNLRSGGQIINANFAELDQRTSTAQGVAEAAGAAASAAQATADAAVTDAELQAGLDGKVDKVSGKGLSPEEYTADEKAKLAAIQPAHYRGTFTTLAALQAGVTSPVAGDYADVDAGVGSDVQRYIWDVTDSKWVLQGASGGGPSNTDNLPEGTTNRYFTGARVLATVLSGLSLVTGGAIVAADSVLVAFGKLQKQITDLAASLSSKAASGANSDITSLSGLTTALSIAQGGTGGKTLAEAQANLGIGSLNALKSCFAYLGSNQTIPNNTWTKAAINTLALGESTWLDATNNRITPGVGTYLVVLRGYITACNDQDYASVSARKNGVEYFKGLSITQSYPSGADLNPLGVGLIALESATDYIELWFLTDSRNSGTRTLNNGSPRTYIQVVKIA